MPRPNNFWDVLAQTADYASQAIPAAQRENRQIAQERERFGLRAQQERDQFNETRRYHDAQIGLQSARLNRPQAHPAENPTFERVLLDMAQNPDKYTPEQIRDFKDAASEFYNLKRPEPQPKEWQQPPNHYQNIVKRRDELIKSNANLRKTQGTTTIIPGENGGQPTYAPPTTPELSDSMATEQALKYEIGSYPSDSSNIVGLRSRLFERNGVTGSNIVSQEDVAKFRKSIGMPTQPINTPQQVDLSTLSDEELDALERQITGQ